MKSGFLANLKNQGYSVKIRHVRRFYDVKNRDVVESTLGHYLKNKEVLQWVVLGKGGATHVTATSPTGKTFDGISRCHPSDNYNRAIGIETALKDAFSSKVKIPSCQYCSEFSTNVFK